MEGTIERVLTSVYIGVVGAELELGECRDSIENLKIRPGDTPPVFYRFTKGFEAREAHIRKFLNETEHGAIFLMDADMYFPPDALERLRVYGMPYLSGYYLRRLYNPIMPVWFNKFTENMEFPMSPMTKDPERGTLHELGGSGWGCMLIHREVFEAVHPLLKGEPFVIEDDMDIWPYNIDTMMECINGLQGEMSYSRIQQIAKTLKEEFKPLRGRRDNVGSDIRFPYFAKKAGYTLYGEPDVRVHHNMNYPLAPDDYTKGHKEPGQQRVTEATKNAIVKKRKNNRKRLKGLQDSEYKQGIHIEGMG